MEDLSDLSEEIKKIKEQLSKIHYSDNKLEGESIIRQLKSNTENIRALVTELNIRDYVFDQCIHYLKNLEEEIIKYKSDKYFGKIRCNAFDQNGDQCKNIARQMVEYFGDPSQMKLKNAPKSTFPAFCNKHTKMIQNSGIKYRKLR
ncbi:MAG: hypothetical protein WAO91_01835 [Candidatus Nitrosotenuis sp.]